MVSSSHILSPPRRTKSPTKLLSMLPRTTNNGEVTTTTLPYCRPLSPSEELVDTNNTLLKSSSHNNNNVIPSPRKKIMRLASIHRNNNISVLSSDDNSTTTTSRSHRHINKKNKQELDDDSHRHKFMSLESSKSLSSTSCSSQSNASFEKKSNRFTSSTSPIRKRVSGLLIKAGNQLSSRSLFGNKSNNVTTAAVSSPPHSCSNSCTEECSSSSNRNENLTTTTTSTSSVLNQSPRKTMLSPHRRMIMNNKKSQINKEAISQFLGLDQTGHQPMSLDPICSTNNNDDNNEDNNTKSSVVKPSSPNLDNNQANKSAIAVDDHDDDADDDDTDDDSDDDDDDDSVSECDSMACGDPDDSDEGSHYEDDEVIIVQKECPILLLEEKRKQMPRRPKRQNSIGARMWNKIINTMTSQRKLIIPSIDKRHVTFGMESDNEIIHIRPYYKYKSIKKNDLWWTTSELLQIRIDNKNLVKSTRMKSSLNSEVHFTSLQNDFIHYNNSYRNAYNKIMLNQGDVLTNNEKNDLIKGLANGHRGLEAYSPHLAHTRHEMIEETVGSIVSLYKNISLTLHKQQQKNDDAANNNTTIRNTSTSTSSCSNVSQNNEELVISLHRLARIEVANYEIAANLVQNHSEALTAGCRMWAKTIGEVEACSASYECDSSIIAESTNFAYYDSNHSKYFDEYGNILNEDDVISSCNGSNNIVVVLKQEQIVI